MWKPWGRVRRRFITVWLPTRPSWPSSCEPRRSAPPWFWGVKPQQERGGGDPPHSHPGGSRRADGKPRIQWERRGSRESDGQSSPPGGSMRHSEKFLDHVTQTIQGRLQHIHCIMGHRNTDTSLTLLVAMKRVKRRMRVLLDTGSQWASCMVKRMAPYRLALVGLQTRKLYRQRMFVMMCTVWNIKQYWLQYNILFYSILYQSIYPRLYRTEGPKVKRKSILFYSILTPF